MGEHGSAEAAKAAAPGGEERREVAEEVSVPDVRLVLPADADSVGLARQVVSGVADALGLDGGRAADIALAVTEACTNVVMHAYPDGADAPGGVGTYDLRVWMQHRRLIVTVRDQGQGIAPRVGGKAGLGLGLPLMLAICDEVAFARGSEGSTEVRMTFRRDEPAGTDR